MNYTMSIGNFSNWTEWNSQFRELINGPLQVISKPGKQTLVKSLTGSLRIFEDPQRPAKDPQG